MYHCFGSICLAQSTEKLQEFHDVLLEAFDA